MAQTKTSSPRTDLKFQSTKTYCHNVGLSCCFRQWRANSHCNKLHGYALEVKLIFETYHLDQNNWVVDFGGLKNVKAWLESQFDHKLIVAQDDPDLKTFKALGFAGIADINILVSTGCEAFATYIYNYVEKWLKEEQADKLAYQAAKLLSVEVREHAGNSAICMGS